MDGTERASLLWEKILLFTARRDVILTSVLGLCGIGILSQTQRWLAMTPFEKQLLQDHGMPQIAADIDDSAWIKQHTLFQEVENRPLRVFFSPHALASKLPRQTPLIVFIHGLGGQINQFAPLLQYFGQVADVLSLDLPGCGKSPFVDKSWESYTTDALADLVVKVVEERRTGRKVVLVGHSMGCMIAPKVAMKMGDECLAMVLLCPRAQITAEEDRGRRIIAMLPEFIFNILRKLDRAYILDVSNVVVESILTASDGW